MPVTIYHNPKCAKSRATLALLEARVVLSLSRVRRATLEKELPDKAPLGDEIEAQRMAQAPRLKLIRKSS